MGSYAYTPFPYRRAPELDGPSNTRRPVAIVGAGPVGLAAAIDLALRGVPSVVLDDNDVVSIGSRAICWAKRTLEIFDRLGVGARMVAKGVTWKLGRFYHRDREVYTIDLLPEDGHKMPAFINLQQYYVEQYLIERAGDFPDLIDLRWKHKVVAIEQGAEHARLSVETPDGAFAIDADWVLAADGARSTVRKLLGIAFEGTTFEERFLIVDVRMKADLPNERRFWFEPTFDPGESVLLHRQPDDVYRIDFQLGPDADPEREKEPARVGARVRSVVGDVPFELEWCSVYTFRCARTERFVHDRVILIGDSAHVVSPFGARGGNGGIQDVDNLCWKLAMVVRGEAGPALIASYDEERGRAADENIENSSRTTNFMTPKTAVERTFRDAVLALSAEFPFAQKLVNGGRLSRPCDLGGLSLATPDDDAVAGAMRPGAPCADAPVASPDGSAEWLLPQLGERFTVMIFAHGASDVPGGLDRLPEGMTALVVAPNPLDVAHRIVVDRDGVVSARYGGQPGVTYLIRPDSHVAARFPVFDLAGLDVAYARATARLVA
jgi:3-(3-hydroxy-phenyl)propionate hydroxylase